MDKRLETLLGNIRQNRARFNVDLEEVRANDDLTEAAKRRLIGELHHKASDAHRDLYAQLRTLRAEIADELHQDAFTPPFTGSSAEKMQARAAYAQTLHHVSTVDAAEMQDLWRRAKFAKDTPGMFALGVVALERGNRDVLQKFESTFPDRAEQLQALAAFRSEHGMADRQSQLADRIALTGPSKPAELA